MENEFYESFTSAGKASYEALQKLTELNTTTMGKLTEVQINMANLGIEGSMGQMKLLASTNNYDDLITAESEFASDYSDKILGLAQKTTDILSESSEAMSKWFEENIGSVISVTETKPTVKKKVSKKVITKATAKKKTIKKVN